MPIDGSPWTRDVVQRGVQKEGLVLNNSPLNPFQVVNPIPQGVGGGRGMGPPAPGNVNKIFDFIDDASQGTNTTVVGRKKFDAVPRFWRKLCQRLDGMSRMRRLLDQLHSILQVSARIQKIIDASLQVLH